MSRFIRRFRHFIRRIFSRNRHSRRHQYLTDSGPEQDQQDSDSVQIQFQDSDSVQIQDQQDSNYVQIQDQQDSDSVQIQDQQDSDSVQIQDQQDSDSVQIQDQQDSDSVQIQDQQDSDSVQIPDQQDSDSVQIQDQQDSDYVQILDQEDSDPSQEQFQLDWASVQIPYQPDPDTAHDGGIDSLSSQIASLFFSRLRAPQDSGLYKYDISWIHGLQSPNFSDEPSNFDDVILIFSSHLASLRADPGRLDAVRESRTFRLCLHCIAYRISVCGYLIYTCTSVLKHYAEFARLGFVPPPSEDDITLVEKVRSYRQEEKAELTELLDQARHLGLGQDVDNVTRACQLDLEARRLLCLVCDEEDSGRWDKGLRYTARAVNLLSERHESWPSWPDLDLSRQQIMEPVEVYGYEDRDNEAEWRVLIHLLRVSYSLLPPHAADVRKHVNFHSRYLDQEVGFMSRFLAERSGKSIIQAIGKLMTGDDKNFCELGIELSVRFSPPLPTHRFGLRLYRLCLRMKDQDLADKVISMRFTENPDQQQVTELLNQVLTKLRYNPRQASNRLILNTEHSDDVIGEYKLPELIKEVSETLPDEPWCVKAFQNRTENVSSRQRDPTTGSSGRRFSTTEEPSSSSVREFWKNQQTTFDPRKENQEVAQLLTSKNSLPDSDICNILFSYIDVPAENPFILRWKERNDVNKMRKINIAAGVPYHCSVLTYHPAQDEWSVRSDMCRISGPLAVEQEGATCVPFVGDCGIYSPPDSFVFKIHKSRSEHALREYAADVRAQSTAAWYVNRFRELTQDRFGVLTMIHSDLVIVYQDSHRDTILELMTREKIFRGGSAVKFDRYINNTKWRNKSVNTDLIEAFSHFTHHESGGTLMVTDIQGWVARDEPRDNIGYTLTDPVIHCPAVLHWFGGNNHRQNGINMFYRSIHPTCNSICESLNLVRP